MRSALLVSLLFGTAIAPGIGAADQLPIEDFVRKPTYSGVKISPTGEYLAMSVDRGEQFVLVVLKTADLSPVKINTLPDDKSVGQFHWVGPNRLMFNAVKNFGRFAQPFSTGEWFAVDADGNKPRPLVFYGTRDATQRSKTVSGESFGFLDPLVDDDRKVLMSVSYRRSAESSGTEVVEMDTYTGRRKTLARAPRGNCSLALDSDKSPRFAVCYDSEDDEGNYDSHTELYRRDSKGDWTLLNRSQDSGKQLAVLGTAKDGRIYATQSENGAPAAVGTLDPETGVFNALLQDKISDVAGFITSADNETLIGAYTEAGVPHVTLFEEAHPDAELYASLAAAFPGQFVNFSSATADGQKIVVSVYSDRNPGQLYLYDRASGKARFMMQSRQWIDSEKMATVKPFTFVNRDGMRLYGYLTIPNGSDGKNLPLIVNPHGGPMGPRDNWGFNWETQLFANRGYMVLQVNFRGSGGFGQAFEELAFGQWKDGIMNDVIDATRWAIDQGHADPKRICVYGGSFGGYTALMAPAREPDLFACAFGYVGAYDADVQMKQSDTSKSSGGIRYLERALGKTEQERASVMPLAYADQIKLPVYMAAGARDPRCPPDNTRRMAEALEKAGNKPEGVLITSGEMHGFYKEENNLELYTEMLAFFDRHIGAASAQ